MKSLIKKLLPDFLKSIIKEEIHRIASENGTYEYISQRKPFLMKELTTKTKCLEFLKNRFINSTNNYPKDSKIRNTLCLHESKTHLTPCSLDMNPKFLEFWGKDKFQQDDNTIVTLVDFAALENNDCTSVCIYVGNQPTANYIGGTRLLEKSYRDLMVNLDKPSEIKIEIKLWSNQGLSNKLPINFNGLKTYENW